jgi:iron complex outermembrane receptor protein
MRQSNSRVKRAGFRRPNGAAMVASQRDCTQRSIAAAVALVCAAASAAAGAAAAEEETLGEIIVTATRRSTSVLDVPYNISAYSSDQLLESHVTNLSDFAKMVPGLAYVDPGPRLAGNNNDFNLRGVNATGTQGLDVTHFAIPTVSTYLGETPMFFNVQTLDLERIEVLRGPQGTLYGAGSLSGTIRFIPNAPQMGQFEASALTDGSKTHYAGQGNYNLGAVVNFPFGESAAFRLSGGYNRQAGFIDQTNLAIIGPSGAPVINGPLLAPGTTLVTQRLNGTNDSEVSFARAALGVNVGPAAYIELHYNYQHTVVGDRQADNPNFPGNSDWEASNRVLTPLNSLVNIVGLDAHIDLGFATLTSATSYSSINTDSIEDDSGFYTTLPSAFYFGYTRFVVPALVKTNQYSFSQELRLASNDKGAVDWLVGTWYNRDIKHYAAEDLPDLGLGAYTAAVTNEPESLFDGPSFIDDVDVTLKDTAIFGELTWHVTDRWQITGGGRQFWQKNDDTLYTALPYCAATGGGCPAVSAGNNENLQDHVFKLNTSYAFDAKNRVYFTFSQGFRPGGANAVPTTGPYAVGPAIAFYQADRTNNYEIGSKGVLLGGKLNYSLAAYYIRWQDFQFDGFTSAGYNAVLNGSEATSKGVEAELSGHLGTHLRYNFGYAYTDATVQQSFGLSGTSGANAGDPMPGVPRNTVSASVDYLQRLQDNYTLDYHINGSYKSSTVSLFNAQDLGFLRMSSFTIWDAALTLGQKKWSVSLYGQNLLDARAVFGGAPASTQGSSAFFLVNRPRTIGLRFTISTSDQKL